MYSNPRKEFIPRGVEFVVDQVVKIDTSARSVETVSGARFDYDWLVIAAG
jgi:sulfide:quinone oxidoreductase